MVLRTAVSFALMLALLWQSFSLASPGVTAGSIDNGSHAVLHWDEVGHHHHDDGTYHVDDSSESLQHLMADHAVVTLALLPSGIDVPRSAPSSTLPHIFRQTAAPPFLGGPYKPPRLTA